MKEVVTVDSIDDLRVHDEVDEGVFVASMSWSAGSLPTVELRTVATSTETINGTTHRVHGPGVVIDYPLRFPLKVLRATT